MPDIWFPYLGIEIDHLNKYAFTIGNFAIAWYGVIIALGVVAGLLMARFLAKKSGQDPEFYVDFLIYALIFGLIGARAYYVAFEWDFYKGDILKILDFRAGGLAIYGGVIAAIITAAVFAKIRKKPLTELLDTAMPGLVLGQAIGRWGNFTNQEAFGSYTDCIFAMRLNDKTAAYTTPELLKNAVRVGGVRYIQVHPTFLYESIGCLLILAIMIICFLKFRKFKGQIACTYMIGYGVLRAFIENLRTDQLKLWNTNFPISVFTSIAFATIGVILMVILGIRSSRAKKKEASKGKNEFAPDLDGDSDEDSSKESVKDSAEAETTSESDNTEEAETSDTASDKDDASENEPKENKEEEKKELTDDDLWG